MKIFLTGGTGFIGRYVLSKLIQNNHMIIAQVRIGSLSNRILHSNIRWIEKDLDDDFNEELQGVDIVLHLASHTPNPPYAKVSECVYWNVYAVAQLFEQAISQGIKRFVNIGSCFEYADELNCGDEGYSVRAPIGPALSYPTSKAAATVTLEGLARENNIELLTLRIFQVFGRGELSTRLYPSVVEAAEKGLDFSMTSGEQVRDFINVEDVADKIEMSLEDRYRPRKGEPKILHIGSGNPQTVRSFVEKIWRDRDAKGQLKIGALPSRGGQFMYIYSQSECLI